MFAQVGSTVCDNNKLLWLVLILLACVERHDVQSQDQRSVSDLAFSYWRGSVTSGSNAVLRIYTLKLHTTAQSDAAKDVWNPPPMYIMDVM